MLQPAATVSAQTHKAVNATRAGEPVSALLARLNRVLSCAMSHGSSNRPPLSMSPAPIARAAAIPRPPYTKAPRSQSRSGLLAVALATIPGCDPVFDLEGAFFPAWMLCLAIGIALTALARLLLARIGIEPYLGPLPLIYTCLAVLLTMATWVFFFRT